MADVLAFTQEISKDNHQYHLTTYFILKFLKDQALSSPITFGQKLTKLHVWTESLIRKADSLYLDKAQVLSDIIFKIAEQYK